MIPSGTDRFRADGGRGEGLRKALFLPDKRFRAKAERSGHLLAKNIVFKKPAAAMRVLRG